MVGGAGQQGKAAVRYQGSDMMFPATWPGIAPFPLYDRPKVPPAELASAILGIIGICIHWMAFFRLGLLLFVAPMVLSILAICFGFFSIRRILRKGYARKEREGTVGMAGLSLGILTLMFTIAWLVLAQTYLWGWRL